MKDNKRTDTLEIKALTFDVFGTVVDWRGSIIREGKAFGAAPRTLCGLGGVCGQMARRIRSLNESRP